MIDGKKKPFPVNQQYLYKYDKVYNVLLHCHYCSSVSFVRLSSHRTLQ